MAPPEASALAAMTNMKRTTMTKLESDGKIRTTILISFMGLVLAICTAAWAGMKEYVELKSVGNTRDIARLQQSMDILTAKVESLTVSVVQLRTIIEKGKSP